MLIYKIIINQSMRASRKTRKNKTKKAKRGGERLWNMDENLKANRIVV